MSKEKVKQTATNYLAIALVGLAFVGGAFAVKQSQYEVTLSWEALIALIIGAGVWTVFTVFKGLK